MAQPLLNYHLSRVVPTDFSVRSVIQRRRVSHDHNALRATDHVLKGIGSVVDVVQRLPHFRSSHAILRICCVWTAIRRTKVLRTHLSLIYVVVHHKNSVHRIPDTSHIILFARLVSEAKLSLRRPSEATLQEHEKAPVRVLFHV